MGVNRLVLLLCEMTIYIDLLPLKQYQQSQGGQAKTTTLRAPPMTVAQIYRKQGGKRADAHGLLRHSLRERES